MQITDKILEEVKNLPTLPSIFSTLSEVIDDPITSADKLAKIISPDQASVFKILKVANSPFYGFRGKIDTISQAVLYLGFNEIKNIVFALSVLNIFSKDKIVLNLRPIDLWAHSIGVGIVTRTIGRAVGERNLENFFLSGILHDIGKIVLLEYAAKEYGEVLNIVETKKCRINEAEMEIFGIDHAILGKMIANKWKLPQSIQDSIYYHHSGPENKETKENNVLISSVHLANIIARILEFGFPGDNLIPQPSMKIWEILKLSNDYIPSVRDKIEKDFENTVRLMLIP